MITLPTAKDQKWPLIRILVMPPGHWTDPTQPWTILDQPNRISVPGSKPNGYELQFCDRVTLPEYGQAEFLYHYGMINGVQRTAQDLTGYHVRIQGADEPADLVTTPVWRTVYLGTVDSQVDMPWSSGTGSGDRHYYCVDLLYRTSRWPLCHHSVLSNGTLYPHTFGHPGYNYAISGYFRRLMGNRDLIGRTTDPFGDNPPGYRCHTFIGSDAADLWDDASVVQHALWSSRAKGDPIFSLKNPQYLSGDSFPWSVSDGEKCWSLLNRVLSRQRGRGIAELDWADDYSNPTANIMPIITLQPQNYDDTTVYPPQHGITFAYLGANSVGNTVSVDLVNDHRFVDGSLTFAVNDSTGVDYLETYGEQIETLVTLTGTEGTLEKRWADSDAVAFLALPTPTQRQDARWKSVFQRWSIPVAWDYLVGDGNGGAKSTCVYNCDNLGLIVAHTLGGIGSGADTSPILIKIGTDIPIYDGYDYAPATPVRYDGAADYLSPPRNPPIILLRSGSDLYVNAAVDLGFGMQVDDFGVFVIAGFDQAAGTRYLSGVGSSANGAFADTALVISVGLTFGHRVRMANSNNIKNLDGTDSGVPFTDRTAGRKLYLYIPGVHLWLSHPSAIWQNNKMLGTVGGSPGKRAACGGASPGIIRDDRDRLAVTHALAWSWYGTRRTSAQWSLRACGLLKDFEVDGGTRVAFPALGQVTKDITASSGTQSTKTPISRVHYNHLNGTTAWFTDWADLDTEGL